MKIYRISAVTFKVGDMARSCSFYSRLPGFKLVYGGADARFTTFEVAREPRMSFNLELSPTGSDRARDGQADFGRVIFYTSDVDALYRFIENERTISGLVTLEGKPSDAPWGERFFHLRDPDGYQLSFAQPVIREGKGETTVRDGQS